jgi:hypothetical protein
VTRDCPRRSGQPFSAWPLGRWRSEQVPEPETGNKSSSPARPRPLLCPGMREALRRPSAPGRQALSPARPDICEIGQGSAGRWPLFFLRGSSWREGSPVLHRYSSRLLSVPHSRGGGAMCWRGPQDPRGDFPCPAVPQPLLMASLDDRGISSEYLWRSCHESLGIPLILEPAASPSPDNLLTNANLRPHLDLQKRFFS